MVLFAVLSPTGAFIDIGGVSGLLHISEISHEHIDTPHSVFNVNDELKVMIIDLDAERGRISLSTKQLEPEPGDMIKNRDMVFDKAEEMAAKYREQMLAKQQGLTLENTEAAEVTAAELEEVPSATEEPEIPAATEEPEAPTATEETEAPTATEETEAPTATEEIEAPTATEETEAPTATEIEAAAAPVDVEAVVETEPLTEEVSSVSEA